MKKVVLLLLLVTSVFFLVGCGKDDDEEESEKSSKTKTLNCVAEISGVKATIDLKYNTKKEVVESAKATYEFDLSSLSQEQKDIYKKQDFCQGYDTTTFDNCKSSIKGDVATWEMEMNIDHMVQAEFGGDEHFSFDNIKKGYEENLKATCTVK